MEKEIKINKLTAKKRAVNPEMLSLKVATIVSKTVEKCNKLLLPLGCAVDVKLDFYTLNKEQEEAKRG